MGGFHPIAAQKAIAATEGNMEEAVNLMLSQPAEFPEVPQELPQEEDQGAISDGSTVWNEEWDTLLDELAEMGFEDLDTNRSILSEVNGDVKDAVKELVNRERLGRQ